MQLGASVTSLANGIHYRAFSTFTTHCDVLNRFTYIATAGINNK